MYFVTSHLCIQLHLAAVCVFVCVFNFYIWTFDSELLYTDEPNSLTISWNQDPGPRQSYFTWQIVFGFCFFFLSSSLAEWEKPCWFFSVISFHYRWPRRLWRPCLLIRRAVYPIHFTQLPISIISIWGSSALAALLCLPSLHPWLIHYIF